MKRKRKQARGGARAKQGPIALLTDFGERDHYVGTVKGVILSINPRGRIVDISHAVGPQNNEEAGYLLWASYEYFPDGTIFVCVVDPGVGSARKIICVNTARHTFIAPDNGLLDLVVRTEKIRSAYEIIRPPRIGMKPISATFHGRDIFAPLAAHLSLGESVSKFGRTFDLKRPSPVLYAPEESSTTARVLHVDRFGNLVTNIPERYFAFCAVKVGSSEISKRIHNFAEAPKNQCCLIVGSSGLVEIVVNEGSAANALGADAHTLIAVSLQANGEAF